MAVVFIGCGMQALTSTVAILLLALLLLDDTSADGNDAVFSVGGMDAFGLILFTCVCLCGIVENAGSGILSVAVEKDWVPTIFEGFAGGGRFLLSFFSH